MKKTFNSFFPASLQLALFLFGSAGLATMYILPNLFMSFSGDTPDLAFFLVVGVMGVLITAGFYAYISQLKLGFPRTALILAFGYSALIVTTKLFLAPFALYLANRNEAFDALYADPNNGVFYLMNGLVILFVYLVVFHWMYKYFLREVKDAVPGKNLKLLASQQTVGKKTAKKSMRSAVIVLSVLLVAGALLSGGWALALLSALPIINYIMYVISTFGVVIAVALLLALWMALRAFQSVANEAVRIRDATILASFFWVALGVILIYHVMWFVLMIILVAMWPFNTYTPK